MALFRTRLIGICLVAASSAVAAAAAAEGTSPAASEQEYWARFDEHDWTAAVTSAEALVEAARQDGANPVELAEVLSMLGNAQLATGNLAGAEAAFTEALVLAERNSPPISARLLEPLRGLGYTLAAGGRHEEAVVVLDRSLHITHRSLGLFDMGQEPVLRQLAVSLSQLGRLSEARQHMNYLLRASERAYGAGDPRRVPVMSAYAQWNAETGDMSTARDAYRAAIELVEEIHGKDSPALVEPLSGFARSYMLELHFGPLGMLTTRDPLVIGGANVIVDERPLNPRQLPTDGEGALLRTVQIAEAADPPRSDLLVAALLQTGDWYQVKTDTGESLEYYRRAWQASRDEPVPTSDETAPEAQALLGHPVQLYYPTPPLATRYLWLAPEEVQERYVEVQFTVTREGLVQDEQVIDRNGTRRQASEALQAIRAARYRPRFVDGEPVDTPRMTRREVFRIKK